MSNRKGGYSEAPRIFTQEYYQHLHNLGLHHWWAIGMRAIAERMLNPHFQGRQNLRIMDAGCGTGIILSWLERYTSPEKIVGFEISKYALDFCKGQPLRQLAQASITQLPFLDESFDLITCLDVLQHLPQDGSDRQAFLECWRVIKPGGFLYLRTNACHTTEAQYEKLAGREPKPLNYHQYPREELIKILIQTGFIPERVTYANMLPALVKIWLHRLNPFRLREGDGGQDRGLTMRVPPIWLNNVLKFVMGAEARYLAEPERKLPYGHSLICLAAKPARTGGAEV